jgi:hypothetical protein
MLNIQLSCLLLHPLGNYDKDTVIYGRLANPVIIARPVRFILYEQRMYEETSAKIV